MDVNIFSLLSPLLSEHVGQYNCKKKKKIENKKK